jgi:Skp family chaperone for outer membrane proteins
MKPRLSTALLALPFVLCLALPATAQVTLKRDAVTYYGTAATTSAPSTIDETKVKEATKEWQKIQSEGIDKESAQGKQLLQKMNERIREVVKEVAEDESRDLVVRKDDVHDKKGKELVDLTDKVVKKLSE